MKKKPAPAQRRPPPALTWEEVGSGITKHQVPKITGLAQSKEIAIRRSINVPPQLDTLDFAVKAAARFLDKYGIEYRPDDDYLAEDGRTYSLVELVKAMGHREYESPLWYSARIFQCGILMQECIAGGKARMAADHAFMIGFLHAEARLKGKWEPDALLGQGGRETRRRGGQTTGQRTREAAAKQNAEVLRLNNELASRHPSERERAAIIARKIKRPVDTIRDILKRSK